MNMAMLKTPINQEHFSCTAEKTYVVRPCSLGSETRSKALCNTRANQGESEHLKRQIQITGKRALKKPMLLRTYVSNVVASTLTLYACLAI